MTTNHTSLKNLAKSILNKLENRKFIVFDPKKRGELQQELYERLGCLIITEEDINNEVRGQVASVSDAINDENITETDAYQSQKRAIKSRLSENEVQGFYLKEMLRDVCADCVKFLFDSSYVEDVFESDEVLQKLIMETIQAFDESKIA